MDQIQITIAVFAVVFLLLDLIHKTIAKKRVDIIGTGIVTILAFILLLVLNVTFYATGHTGLEILGGFFVVVGVVLYIWARRHLGANYDNFWTDKDIPKHRHLVQSGPYKSVRHPIYSAMFLLYGGLLIVFFHLITLVAVLLYFIAVVVTVVREERFLMQNFQEYGRYKTRTGMFLPKI